MTSLELVSKTKRVIEMNRDRYTLNTAYFNPMYGMELISKVPELKEFGFSIIKNEVESTDGTAISGKVIKGQEVVSLGTVLLDGMSINVKSSLITVDKLLNFIRINAD